MKILNKILCLTAFFAMGSVSAKPMGAARPAATAPGTPVVRPGAPAGRPVTPPATKPSVAAKSFFKTPGKTSFKQLRDQVLAMKQSDVIDRGLLSGAFVQKMEMEVSKSVLFDPELNPAASELLALETLLKTARDKFLQFSGDNQDDLSSLKAINGQINTIVDRLNK